MADYYLLEDGVSHLEIEGVTDDLLLDTTAPAQIVGWGIIVN